MQFKFKSTSLGDGEDSFFSVAGSIQGKDYPDVIGEPLTKGTVVPFLLRNSITEVDQCLTNVKFCLAPFCWHLSRADGSIPFLCSGGASSRGPGSAIPVTFLSGAVLVVRGGFALPKHRDG